jgi:hypothetical protein
METQPLSDMMHLALGHAERAFKMDVDRIVTTGIREAGLDPDDGWGFDPRSRSWVRRDKVSAPAGPPTPSPSIE